MSQEEKFLEAAIVAVKKAEPIFSKHFGRAGKVINKDDPYRSLVTDIDREIEAIITAQLTKCFPDHSISGEELPVQKKSSSYTWYIDPIDGTVNYVRGLYGSSISVGLWLDNAPIAGVVADPVNDVIYSAIRGRGSFKNGKAKLSVSTISTLADGIGLAGRARQQLNGEADKALGRVAQKMYRNREFGGSALELCHMAEGKIDLYLSERIKTYDVAASVLVLVEAGGRATDWQGNAFTPASKQIAASNGKIHEELLRTLNGI
jgi:myo-inositol-1(or 4)-monophosphatase